MKTIVTLVLVFALLVPAAFAQVTQPGGLFNPILIQPRPNLPGQEPSYEIRPMFPDFNRPLTAPGNVGNPLILEPSLIGPEGTYQIHSTFPSRR